METRPKRPCWNCGAREAEVLVSRQELCDPCGEMYWRLLLARVAIADAIREDIPGGDRPPRSLSDEEIREIALQVFGPPLGEIESASPDGKDEPTPPGPDDERPTTQGP